MKKRPFSQAAITKMATGIQGFDEITEGGLPRGRTTLVMGGAGCGKTVFALQTLVNGAQHAKEAGIFIAFEESTSQIIANATTFGWDLGGHLKKKVFFLDAQLAPEVVKAGDFDLAGILTLLSSKATELGARRVVFDGIDVLLGLLDDPAAERREIFRIRDWLVATGLTGIITQKVGTAELDQRYNFLQFMVDCVVVLRHQVVDGTAFRNLRVVKYRGSGFGADEFPTAACKRGERTLYVSFDEGANQIVRNLRSVYIRLAPHVRSGMLTMYSTRTRGPNVADQFGVLRAKVLAERPRCLVIDPLSALSTKLSHIASADAAQQFLDFLKAEGVTVVNTSLMDGLSTDEATATGISTIADTWIHLSYVVQDGERNRALTIVKSRGTGHSNQVRELSLSDKGVTLEDVFVAQGKVLMGVARWQWEQEGDAAMRRTQIAAELKRMQLEVAQAEAAARLQVVQAEMDARSAEIEVLRLAAGSASKLRADDRLVIRRMRHADDEGREVAIRTGNAGTAAHGGE